MGALNPGDRIVERNLIGGTMPFPMRCPNVCEAKNITKARDRPINLVDSPQNSGGRALRVADASGPDVPSGRASQFGHSPYYKSEFSDVLGLKMLHPAWTVG